MIKSKKYKNKKITRKNNKKNNNKKNTNKKVTKKIKGGTNEKWLNGDMNYLGDIMYIVTSELLFDKERIKIIYYLLMNDVNGLLKTHNLAFDIFINILYSELMPEYYDNNIETFRAFTKIFEKLKSIDINKFNILKLLSKKLILLFKTYQSIDEPSSRIYDTLYKSNIRFSIYKCDEKWYNINIEDIKKLINYILENQEYIKDILIELIEGQNSHTISIDEKTIKNKIVNYFSRKIISEDKDKDKKEIKFFITSFFFPFIEIVKIILEKCKEFINIDNTKQVINNKLKTYCSDEVSKQECRIKQNRDYDIQLKLLIKKFENEYVTCTRTI